MSEIDPGTIEESRIEQLAREIESDIEEIEQPIGGAAADDLPDDIETVPEEHRLRTSGVLSTVRDDRGEQLGHILLTEWDECDDVMIPLSIATQKPGINVLLRSSATNYHLWNLSVREFEEQLRDVAAGSGDLGHVRWAARRGYFVLRVLPKIRESDGSIYKEGPEIVRVFHSSSEFPQSLPHLDLLRELAQRQGDDEILEDLDEALSAAEETIGSELSVDHYQTITDQLKAEGFDA